MRDLAFVGQAGARGFVSASSVAGDSMTLPPHRAGDLIVVFAYRDGSGTSPSLVSGWNSVVTFASGVSASARGAWKFAASNSEVSGTWANASHLTAYVFRGARSAGPIGNFGTYGNSSTSIVRYGAVSEAAGDGSSWFVGWSAVFNGTSEAGASAPAGMVARAAVVPVATRSVHDTGAAHGGNWPLTDVALGVGRGVLSVVVEVRVGA